MADRSRWPDERIDDLHDIIKAVSALPAEIARMRVQQEELKEDVRRLERTVDERARNVRNLVLAFAAPTASGLVLSAIALLFGVGQ